MKVTVDGVGWDWRLVGESGVACSLEGAEGGWMNVEFVRVVSYLVVKLLLTGDDYGCWEYDVMICLLDEDKVYALESGLSGVMGKFDEVLNRVAGG